MSILRAICRMTATACLALTAAAAEHSTVRPHPGLLHDAGDRVRILQEAGLDPATWTPVETMKDGGPAAKAAWSWYGRRYEDHLPATYLWEGPRSEALLQLALLSWLAGRDLPRPTTKWMTPSPAMPTLHAALRSGILAISMPDGREKDKIKGPGTQDQWGFLLDAGVSLWRYALVYDLASAPEVAPGVGAPALDELYRRLADGILHQLVDHLHSLNGPGSPWAGSAPIGNNWISRELAGVGMACLAMQDRLLAEPAGSQRRLDYDDGLVLVRSMSTRYLQGWAAMGDADAAYYYEGPHYFRFWIDTFLPFAYAHGRAFPDTATAWPALSTARNGPMATFMRCHARFVLPTHRDKAGIARWTSPSVDDSWQYPEDTAVPMAVGLAYLDGSDTDLYLDTLAANPAAGWSDILVGQPFWSAVAARKPARLADVVAAQRAGLALVRTGPEAMDLTCLLKNTWTQVGPDGAAQRTGHAHPDNGEVIAYRDAETVLLDPGYGSGGYANPQHQAWFCDWSHHNTLLVESGGGFSLPFWKHGDARAVRIATCARRSDDWGAWLEIRAELPTHARHVIVPDRDTILVIDRLRAPARIRLCWWGNGSTTGRDNTPDAKGRAQEGDAGRVVTASIDTAAAQALWFRGPATATRLSVAWPRAVTVTDEQGEDGPWWYPVNRPITGMLVTSTQPTRAAVTLVEVGVLHDGRPAGAQVRAEAVVDTDGALQSVTVRRPGTPALTYAIAADGTITRRTAE